MWAQQSVLMVNYEAYRTAKFEEYCVVYGKINLILNDLCENVLNYEFNPLSECHTEYKSIPI